MGCDRLTQAGTTDSRGTHGPGSRLENLAAATRGSLTLPGCPYGVRPIGNFFQRIKEFRRIAPRCDKADISDAAAIDLVAAFQPSNECLQDPRTIRLDL
jgi:hypothetical protein